MWPFNRHKHRWVAFKVIPMERAYYNKAGVEVAAKPVTDVYEKCLDCPKTIISEWDGEWTLAEVQGKV